LKTKVELGSLVHYLFHREVPKSSMSLGTHLNFPRESLQFSERVLGEFGNISSVSVLVVLEKWLADPSVAKPGLAFSALFGPGYSTEIAPGRKYDYL